MPANPAGAALLDDFNRAAINGTGLWPTRRQGDTACTLVTVGSATVGPNGSTASRSGRFATSFAADQEFYLDLPAFAAASDIYLYCRMTGATAGTNDGYEVGVEGDIVKAWRCDNGSFVALTPSTTPLTVVAGDAIGVSMVGSTLSFWHKPAAGAWTEVVTWTDATYNIAGRFAVEIIGSTATRLDNLRGGAVVSTLLATSRARRPLVVQQLATSRARRPLTVTSTLLATARARRPVRVEALVTSRVRRPLPIGSTVARARRRRPIKVYRGLVQIGAGVVDATSRSIVRTPAGRVYAFLGDDAPQRVGGGSGVIRAYRSDQTGRAITSFAEVDGANRPVASAANRVLSVPDAWLDVATGIVHLVYHNNGTQGTNTTNATNTQVLYRTFDTNTDTWGSAETVATGAFGTQTATTQRATSTAAIAVTDDGTIHVVYSSSLSTVVHRTRTGPATWSAPTTISNAETRALHNTIVVDRDGASLHLAWYDEAADRRMRYCKRSSGGAWGAPETVAVHSTDDVAWHNNHDQCGSIALAPDGQPVVMWLSQLAADFDDPTGNHVKIRRRQSSGTWLNDHPTRIGQAGVHAHTPHVAMQGGDLYAFIAHGDAPELWPGYAVKPAGGAWTGGNLGVVIRPGTNGTDPGHTMLFDGSAYVGGVYTSKGAVGSETSTLDGSASVRYDPRGDVEPAIFDVLLWDEDVDANSTGVAFYSAVPTAAAVTTTPVTSRARRPLTVLATVTARRRRPLTVLQLVAGRARRPLVVLTTVTRRARRPLTVLQLATARARRPLRVLQLATAGVRRALTVLAFATARVRRPARVLALATSDVRRSLRVLALATSNVNRPLTILQLATQRVRRPTVVLAAVTRRVRRPVTVQQAAGVVSSRVRRPLVLLATRTARVRRPVLVEQLTSLVTSRVRRPVVVRAISSARVRRRLTVTLAAQARARRPLTLLVTAPSRTRRPVRVLQPATRRVRRPVVVRRFEAARVRRPVSVQANEVAACRVRRPLRTLELARCRVRRRLNAGLPPVTLPTLRMGSAERASRGGALGRESHRGGALGRDSRGGALRGWRPPP